MTQTIHNKYSDMTEVEKEFYCDQLAKFFPELPRTCDDADMEPWLGCESEHGFAPVAVGNILLLANEWVEATEDVPAHVQNGIVGRCTFAAAESGQGQRIRVSAKKENSLFNIVLPELPDAKFHLCKSEDCSATAQVDAHVDVYARLHCLRELLHVHWVVRKLDIYKAAPASKKKATVAVVDDDQEASPPADTAGAATTGPAATSMNQPNPAAAGTSSAATSLADHGFSPGTTGKILAIADLLRGTDAQPKKKSQARTSGIDTNTRADVNASRARLAPHLSLENDQDRSPRDSESEPENDKTAPAATTVAPLPVVGGVALAAEVRYLGKKVYAPHPLFGPKPNKVVPRFALSSLSQLTLKEPEDVLRYANTFAGSFSAHFIAETLRQFHGIQVEGNQHKVFSTMRLSSTLGRDASQGGTNRDKKELTFLFSLLDYITSLVPSVHSPIFDDESIRSLNMLADTITQRVKSILYFTSGDQTQKERDKRVLYGESRELTRGPLGSFSIAEMTATQQ